MTSSQRTGDVSTIFVESTNSCKSHLPKTRFAAMAPSGPLLSTLVIAPSNLRPDYSRTLSARTCTGNFASDRFTRANILDIKPNTSTENGLLTGKILHVALPIRWSLVGQPGRTNTEMACTYDIHPHGARLLSSRSVNVGDLVLMERGRHKAICQVIWAGHPDSSLRGQFAVQCVEGRPPWDEELRQMEEQYQPVILDGSQRRASAPTFARPDINRRRRPRFPVQGQAEVTDGIQRVAGKVQELSEYGARISAADRMRPGTDFRLTLNILDISVALKAQVKYLTDNLGMGVEFQEIRRGDRPLLTYVLGKLRTMKMEDFVEVEVVTEPLAVAAG